MVDDILRKNADFIIAPLAMLPQRYEYIDYLWPISGESCAFFIKNPNKETPHWTIFTEPFKMDLWMTLFLAAFLTANILFFIDVISDQTSKVKVKKKMLCIF